MKSRKHKHLTTKNNHIGSSKTLTDFVNNCKAKGARVAVRTDTEPIADPVRITFCFKTNTVVLAGSVLREMKNYYHFMKGNEKMMLEQVIEWNQQFTSMPDSMKCIWCMNIYCLTKAGIIINNEWNGVEYLVAG
jgi:hypothetical protein